MVEPAGEPSDSGAIDALPEVKRPYDPGRDCERLRGKLAAGLVILLGATIVASFVWIAVGWGTADQLDALLDRFIAPLVALTGTALGFYFGGTAKGN